jgi:hypothetical protein
MSGFLCLGIGIVMLIATIWAINQPTFSSTQNIFFKAILGFDFFVICASIIGIVGIYKKI